MTSIFYIIKSYYSTLIKKEFITILLIQLLIPSIFIIYQFICFKNNNTTLLEIDNFIRLIFNVSLSFTYFSILTVSLFLISNTKIINKIKLLYGYTIPNKYKKYITFPVGNNIENLKIINNQLIEFEKEHGINVIYRDTNHNKVSLYTFIQFQNLTSLLYELLVILIYILYSIFEYHQLNLFKIILIYILVYLFIGAIISKIQSISKIAILTLELNIN